MLNLQLHHIADVYSWVDENLPQEKNPKGGRPCIISDNEVITLLIWNVISLHQKTQHHQRKVLTYILFPYFIVKQLIRYHTFYPLNHTPKTNLINLTS